MFGICAAMASARAWSLASTTKKLPQHLLEVDCGALRRLELLLRERRAAAFEASSSGAPGHHLTVYAPGAFA